MPPLPPPPPGPAGRLLALAAADQPFTGEAISAAGAVAPDSAVAPGNEGLAPEQVRTSVAQALPASAAVACDWAEAYSTHASASSPAARSNERRHSHRIGDRLRSWRRPP